MLEYYAAYWNYQDNMSFIQAMVQEVVGKIYNGSLKVRYGDVELDFSGEWPVYVYRDVVLRDCGIDIDKFTTYDALNAEIRKRGIEIDYEEGMGWGKLVDKLYKKVTRPKLIQPCFLVNQPTELVPLARASDQNPKRLDMFQVVVSGFEISKAYSELVDPIEQRRRFEDQAAMKRKGDEEMLDVDEDYLRAMEYGMPPVSGVGIGIDRLVALLTDAPNLRDVIFFPLMRQENIL
jgi:lysyl-tRNA synthetase class 2